MKRLIINNYCLLHLSKIDRLNSRSEIAYENWLFCEIFYRVTTIATSIGNIKDKFVK